jgi:asparagine synthase (glutamine-hydrolysing)
MCGIAGFASPDSPEQAERTLRTMISAIAHRGPDGEGIERWPGVLLGHRRLAIIDLSEAGHQPMLSDDGRVGIVFNGCIYNFLELRKELEALGHSFRSQCDTEVLVRGYQQWGIDALVPRLRGMFAFAIWDDARQTLTLVRDRLGVKPLIYSAANGRLAFASTVDALHKVGCSDGIDPQAVLEFLTYGYVTDDRTIFRNIFKLPAASIVEWREGRLSPVRRYWSLPEIDEDSRVTFDEAVEETERLLVESVRLRLYSDVKIGALLSGGIDSTLVCWAMAKLNANVTAFTVGTPDDAEDEAPQSRETARLLGIDHQVVSLPREERSLLDELTGAFGEPFGAASALAMLQVSRVVKPHATVLLTGDGGDDVFLGYRFHRDFLWAQQVARTLPSSATPLWRSVRPLVHQIPQFRRPKHFLDYVTGGLGAVARVQVQDGFAYYQAHGMLGERLHDLDLTQRQIPLTPARNLMTDFLNYQQRMWFVAEFLTKVDGATMRHALEARSPFLDHTLWEFAAKLPPQLRLRGGVLKAILREIVRKRVGATVAFRKKQGFSIPVERWVLNQWRGSLQDLGPDSLLARGGWINGAGLECCVKQAVAKNRAPHHLWFLVVLERWLRQTES